MMEDAGLRWTDEGTEAVFTTLGKYWIVFQWIESLLDKLILLAWGSENWTASQKKLAGMSNVKKIECVESMVLTTSDFARVHSRPEFVAHFKSIIEALHTERKRRNSIIHSQILFEIADNGLGPPLLSMRTKSGADDERFERHWLSKEYQGKMLADISKLAEQMNFVYIQLIHDFQAVSPDQSDRSSPSGGLTSA